MTRSCAIFFASAALLGAAGITGPISGYVLDPASRSLRPINGLPGSATMGTALPLPLPAGVAEASARLDYALLAGTRGGPVFLATGLGSGQPAAAPLGGAISATSLVLSGNGSAALLYSSRTSQLQFVSGLPGQPAVAGATDASAAGAIKAMSLDAAGSLALVVAEDGGLYFVSAAGGGPQFIVRIPGAVSVAILPDGTDALVGNVETGDVLLVTNFAAGGAVSTLAGAAEGITSARSVAALDAHHAGVIDGSGRLAVIDIDTGAVKWIPLAGSARGFHPLTESLLLLNQPGTDPLLLFTADQGGTAFFVPPDGPSKVAQGAAVWKHR